jgi:hypothetical protein
MNLPTRLPNWEELARLAASAPRGAKKGDAAKAVAYALELYEKAQLALYRAAMDRGGVPAYIYSESLDGFSTITQRIESFKDVPKPSTFPATLNDFFRLIVKTRTDTATKRLRDFLTAQSGNAAWAAKFIGKIKEADKRGGFFTEQKWQPMAVEYGLWWKQQKSAKSRLSALSKSDAS